MHFAPAPRGLLLQQRTAARVASPSRHPSRLELNAGRAARARWHPRAVLCHCVRAERVSDSIRASASPRPPRHTAHVEQFAKKFGVITDGRRTKQTWHMVRGVNQRHTVEVQGRDRAHRSARSPPTTTRTLAPELQLHLQRLRLLVRRAATHRNLASEVEQLRAGAERGGLPPQPAVPEWSKAVRCAALEAARSSTRGSGGAPSGPASFWEC